MKYFIRIIILCFTISSFAQGTRLLRQPDMNNTHITFCFGSDVWIADRDGSNVKRITSTAAVEKDPYFSPDGKWIAFTSNRFGSNAVYLVSVEGGDAMRLTWHPNGSQVRGWTNDGKEVFSQFGRQCQNKGIAKADPGIEK